jgi:hypothetical protein
MSDSVRAIRLELSLDGDSPAGSARVCGGPSREFVGWLGLVAAIEAILTGDRRPGDDITTNTEGDTHHGSVPHL